MIWIVDKTDTDTGKRSDFPPLGIKYSVPEWYFDIAALHTLPRIPQVSVPSNGLLVTSAKAQKAAYIKVDSTEAEIETKIKTDNRSQIFSYRTGIELTPYAPVHAHAESSGTDSQVVI